MDVSIDEVMLNLLINGEIDFIRLSFNGHDINIVKVENASSDTVTSA